MTEEALLIDKNERSSAMEERMQSMTRVQAEQEIYSLLMEFPMLSKRQILRYFGEEQMVYTVTALNRMLKKGVLIYADFMPENEQDEYYMLHRNDMQNLILDNPNPFIRPARNKHEAICLQRTFWVYLDFKKIGVANNFAREQSKHDFFIMVFEMNYTTYDVLYLEKGRDYVQTFAILKSLEKNYDEWDKSHLHRILLLDDVSQLEDAMKWNLINGLEFYVLLNNKSGKTNYYPNTKSKKEEEK